MTPPASAGAHSCKLVVAQELRRIGADRDMRASALHGPWAPWLRASDDARVGWGVVTMTWPTAWGPPPAAGAAAQDGMTTRLRERAAASYDAYVGLCSLARPVSEAALTRLADEGIRRTRSDLSERVAGLLLREFRTSTQWEAVETAVPGIAEELAEQIGGPQKMSSETFAAAVEGTFHQLWQQHGARNLVRFPPSVVALGSDTRPPLVDSDTRSGIVLGTDRSLYGRYLLHHDPRARTRSSVATGEHPAAARSLPAHPGDRALEETGRACEPLGLRFREHLGVLVALSYGADLIDRRTTNPPGSDCSRGAWSRLRGASEPLIRLDAASLGEAVPDPDLVDAVRDRAEIWLASEEARRLSQTRGDLRSHVDTIGCALARKIWMDLHRRERESYAPCSRPQIAHYLGYAFAKTVPEALSSWGSPNARAPQAVGAGDSTAENSTVAVDYVERRHHTIELLVLDQTISPQGRTRLRDWSSALDADRPDQVRERYVAWAADAALDAGLEPRQLLSAEELVDLLADFLDWGDN